MQRGIKRSNTMEKIFEVIGVIFELFKIHIFILIALILSTVIFVRKKSLMIKILVFVFILLIINIMIFIQGDNRIYETVRGLKVVVVDKATGKFLPDIVVYYCISKGQLLPSLDSTYYEIIMEKYITNKIGICAIPKHCYWKWPKIQWTSADIIAVNLDVIDRIKNEKGGDAKGFWAYFNIFESNNYEYYYNKNEKYRGKVIYFSRNGYTDLEGRHLYKLKRYDLVYMDLKESDDIVIIELEPKR